MRARLPVVLSFTAVLSLITSADAFAGPPDAELVKVANWLVGAFVETPARATTTEAPSMGLSTSLMIRALQDPVVFGDGLYAYVELTVRTGEKPQTWQRVFRLKKAGSRVRVELLRIDGRVVAMLASDPQMLSNLAPADLTKEKGCDLTLEPRGDEYFGGTDPKTCGSDDRESSERPAGLQVGRDRIVLLQRGGSTAGVKRIEFQRAPSQ